MTNEELKAAAELILSKSAIANKYDNAASKIANAYLDSIATAPQWRDRPTCAGLWLFPSRSNMAFHVTCREEPYWQYPCFGPIPERKAT
jgi:hypothetical protein